MQEMKQKKIFAYIVMGIYLLLLCWIILFKLADSIDKIPSMREINLIPFHYDEIIGSKFQITEVLQNVMVFYPCRFLFFCF